MTQIASARRPGREHPPRESGTRSQNSLAGVRLLIMAVVVGTIAASCGAAAAPAATPQASTVAATPQVSMAAASVRPTTSASTPSPRVAQLVALPATGALVSSSILESGFGSVWAASTDGLVKLSATGGISGGLAGTVLDVALGSNAVYALVGGDRNQLLEVDPSTVKALRHWTLADAAKSLVVAGDAAYVDHGTYPATIDRVDLKTGAIRTVTLKAITDSLVPGQALAAGDGLIWATDGTTVLGLDPTDLSVRRTGHISLGVEDIWFGDGSVWAAARGYGGGVHRIDPATGSETARVTSDAVQIAFSPHGVWLSATAGPVEIDPSTTAVLATLPARDVLSSDAAGMAVVGPEVWVDYADTGQIQRIKVP